MPSNSRALLPHACAHLLAIKRAHDAASALYRDSLSLRSSAPRALKRTKPALIAHGAARLFDFCAPRIAARARLYGEISCAYVTRVSKRGADMTCLRISGSGGAL